jgi:taurine dioxygenase
MTTHTPPRLDLRPVTPVIGAEVHGIDLGQPLDGATVAELSDALLQWKVLFFRDQPLTREQHVAFGETFGALTPGHPIHVAPDDRDEVLVVDTRQSKVDHGYVEADPFARPRRTVNGWHTDITFVVNPAAASILRGEIIPPYGGDTLWTNLVAAYEDLSVPVRNFIDGLQAVHVWHGYDGRARDGHDASKPLSAVHPVVRVHPVSGEKALFVNPVFTRYLVGLSDRESEAILGVLFAQLERPQFQVRFRWEPHSLAFWDNRATAHLGPVDLATADFDRRVERVTLVGEVPEGPDGFRSLPLVGDFFA